MTARPTSTREPAGTDRPERVRGRLYRGLHAHPVISALTKSVVAVVGGLILLVGVVMLVTPGPALVMIPLGLAILATEFRFARRWLEKARDAAQRAKEKAEAMDPRVRRRRLLLTGVAVLLLVGAVSAYVGYFGWPHPAVDGWDWVQSMADWVPDLPGM